MTNTTAGGGTLDSSEDMLHPTRWEPEWSRVFRIAHEDEQVDARELLHEIGVGAGHGWRHERAEILLSCAIVQQCVAYELNQVAEFDSIQFDWMSQTAVEELENRLDWPEMGREVGVYAGRDRIVVARRFVHVQMMADRLLQPNP